MNEPLTVKIEADGIAVITFDIPGASMNTLRADFFNAFESTFAEVTNNHDVRAAVLVSGKPDSFIVGADIDMLRDIESVDDAEAMLRRGHAVVARLEASSKPYVAAVHGQALGGGFEVALACQARVLSDSPKTMLGFPEVQLGLLPGLNGLQRLARLTSVQVALEHGLSGKNIYARKAKKLGLADDVVPRPILLDVAKKLALDLARGERPTRSDGGSTREAVMEMALEKNPLGRSVMFRKAREELRKKTGGHYPAPERIVDVLESYAADGFEASLKVETQAFSELVTGEVASNLISVFFATTTLKKDNGTSDPSVVARRVDKIGVLGAGLMGAGIAYVSADKGVDVRLKDRDYAALGRGMKYIADIFDTAVARRRISALEGAAGIGHVSPTIDYSGFANVEVVIEAVFEDLDVKHRVLREFEEHGKPGAIFASNTSSIPITRIAEASKAPQNVVGMHYFSPVHKMPLLEVIRTKQTSDEVVATAVAIGKRQGKTVIVVNDGVGFYTSRVLGPYMNEASWLITEGVAIETIDKAMTSFGWPVGPLTLVDEVGIDVAAHVGPIMLEAFGHRMSPPPTVQRLAQDDRKGRKNERGIYLYGAAAKKKGKGKHVDPSVYALLDLPIPDPKRSPLSREEIQDRCNLQFLNEALHIWGEGILRSPRDGDIGAIFGLGFPPFLGGPFRYVDKLGADKLLRRIEGYRDQFGARWTPAPALVEMARSGKRFHD